MAPELSSLLEIFKGSDGHWDWTRIGGLLGAAGVVIAALTKAGWEVFKFREERRKNKSAGANVTHSGQGPASGRDTWIGGNGIYGADGKQLGQAEAQGTNPLVDWVQRLSAENAGLLRRLEAARKAPQTLGSEQALAEAIHYTEKQAEAQPRAAETLALLAAGKVAEAIPLFEAEAVEKKTASRASAKEAAAYRHLGAIAGLADPKRALEAYEEAVALDPGRYRESLLGGRYSRRLRRSYQSAKAA
jgi:hypothetical protein